MKSPDNCILIPKMLPGSVQAQWVRCGKPNCRCARGEHHGPYWYRFWWEDGRKHKAYVRKADLEAVQAACQEGTELRLTLHLIRVQKRGRRAWLQALEDADIHLAKGKD